MHDAAGKEATAEALPKIIEYLKGQGYKFEVLKLKDLGQ
jgi:peptidoglycan/xylan/chitin deacetylase (PgdA/CDA1 family)